MMKYKNWSYAGYGGDPGLLFDEPKKVVPNMSMSLQEIISRFLRGEPLEIGQEVSYDESGDDDLEKVAHMDLVDREEYVERLKQTQKLYTKQQKDREKRRQDQLDKKAVEDLIAAKMAAEAASKVKP